MDAPADGALSFHDAANIFPMDDEHLDDLAEDIKANGQRIEIELLDRKILDGRRRYMACQIAGVTPRFKKIAVDDPVTYVLSLNLHRRHLTPSQLSMVGARATSAREKLAAEADSRMKAGKKNPKESFPQGQTRDAIGKLVGVSGKSIDHATRVIEKGVPELAKAVEDGRMAVSTAAILATEPPEVQLEEINHPKRNRKYTPANGGGNGEILGSVDDTEPTQQQREKSKAIYLANEAVDALKRIPKNDALRKRGFQIVTDWIRANK